MDPTFRKCVVNHQRNEIGNSGEWENEAKNKIRKQDDNSKSKK